MSTVNNLGWIVLTSSEVLDLLAGIDISESWSGSVRVKPLKVVGDQLPILTLNLVDAAGVAVDVSQHGIRSGQTIRAEGGRSLLLTRHNMETLLYFLSTEMGQNKDAIFKIKVTHRKDQLSELFVGVSVEEVACASLTLWGPDDS